jgi:hypothetical protein
VLLVDPAMVGVSLAMTLAWIGWLTVSPGDLTPT